MRRRFITVFGIAAVLVLATASSAWAHVTLDPQSAVKGSDAVLHFTVPNESDKGATTTKVVITFLAEHPIADALVEPIAGWTGKVNTTHSDTPIKTDEGTTNDRVDNVTFTSSTGTPTGQFQQFSIAVGLPDDADSLLFPTTQTYSDGTVVNWNQAPNPDGSEPENPAPVLKLTAGDDGSTTPTTAANGQATVSASDVKSAKDDASSAKTVGIIAIIIGALGLLAGIGGLLRKRTT